MQITYVQISSITEAATQVAGGHIDSYTGTSEMIGLVKGGNLRMLASASVDRWPEFPEVPTLIELGYETATRQPIIWAGPAGPAGARSATGWKPRCSPRRATRRCWRGSRRPASRRGRSAATRRWS